MMSGDEKRLRGVYDFKRHVVKIEISLCKGYQSRQLMTLLQEKEFSLLLYL